MHRFMALTGNDSHAAFSHVILPEDACSVYFGRTNVLKVKEKVQLHAICIHVEPRRGKRIYKKIKGNEDKRIISGIYSFRPHIYLVASLIELGITQCLYHFYYETFLYLLTFAVIVTKM